MISIRILGALWAHLLADCLTSILRHSGQVSHPPLSPHTPYHLPSAPLLSNHKVFPDSLYASKTSSEEYDNIWRHGRSTVNHQQRFFFISKLDDSLFPHHSCPTAKTWFQIQIFHFWPNWLFEAKILHREAKPIVVLCSQADWVRQFM